ncbi:YslB family protein [Listeria weihenstephanensis]|uniref:YslB family protein n=1 Tax=Listeria weihenstephanensis TaxID=1006155 RepID=A0A841Z235_9LIST|nr:YslB family protein [Listeria weihenstephanensis]MBC1499901.1 YslB family protein [Listeria weihenstephanensis]
MADNEEVMMIPIFGYELIRDTLIPNVLGEETPHILYWAGKELARKYPLETMDELADFFEKASFGDLEVSSEKKDEMIISLSGELVALRLNNDANATFKLEAGFIAEQIQHQKRLYTESYEEVDKRKKVVKIIVKWDRKETVSDDEIVH